LVLAAGCSGGGGGSKFATAEVSGKVLFKGKPLPGGSVSFLPDKTGGVAATATIDEQGNYKITAPVGPVRISVDNRMLQQKAPHGHILKRPGADDPSLIKGQYVALPEKYYSPDSSGLTYTVEGGTQTHDITLN